MISFYQCSIKRQIYAILHIKTQIMEYYFDNRVYKKGCPFGAASCIFERKMLIYHLR